MDKILVATDLSVRSDRAVGRAVRIAARLNAGLTVFHVVDSAMPMDIAKMVSSEAQGKLERFVASRPGADKVKFDVVCAIGDPVDSILQTVQSDEADLLVMGVHRKRSFFDRIRETTMERLVRTSVKPTLLVVDAADHDYANILAAVDMSLACARTIKYAHQLIPTTSIKLFHGVHIPFKGLTGDANSVSQMEPYFVETSVVMKDWFDHAKFPASVPFPIFFEGGPSDVLHKFMAESKPDLLAVGVNTRTGIGRMVLGSFTADLIRDPPCDLLVAR